MKHTMIWIAAFFAMAAFVPAETAEAQTLALTPESSIWIDGTSNQSDWTVYAKEMTGGVRMGEAGMPDSLVLTVVSRQIKSDKSTIMDRKISDALKAREHASIAYQLVGTAVSEGDANMLMTQGSLTIAGVTKDIEMEVSAEHLEGGSVRYTGMTALQFTEYGMKPPTALYGALRTGNDVTVHFDVTFASSE